MDTAKILVVDDEQEHLNAVLSLLQESGFEVHAARDAEFALAKVEEVDPDLVILDVVLHEEFLATGERTDGLTVLRRVRKRSEVPVLMLSATQMSSIKVLALDMGADDYITKPFDPRELMARVRALLRRRRMEPFTGSEIEIAGLRIDPGTRKVWRNDVPIDLTPTEFELLYAMGRHPGQVFSRTQLLRAAGKDGYTGDERVIDAHVSSLRKKLESGKGRTALIATVHGLGYRLEAGSSGK